jgi:alpha-galactosidase
MDDKLKVVLIGAASPQWGHTISRDIIVALSDEKICGTYDPVFVLEDIDEVNLAPQAVLAGKVAEMAGGAVRIESTTDQKKAIEGARFVVVSFAQGSLEAMLHDIEIPLEYGIYQPVGDTISVAGAIRATRNIPAMLGFARDMASLAADNAWMLNLANPMSILCRAVTRETAVNTIGCCHELYGGIRFLSESLGFDYGSWHELLDFDALGVNHCGWMTRLSIEGKDGLAMLRDYLASQGVTSETQRLYDSQSPHLRRRNVKINLFLRHGIFPFSGDRHISEFFTEFLNRRTNKGADFGVLLTTPQERLVEWRGGHRDRVLRKVDGREEVDLNLSQEAASRIIAAITLDEPFHDIGNVPYHGDTLPGIPDGAVLERMVTYSASGPAPETPPPLPDEPQQHLGLIAGMIEDIVEASVNGNRALLVDVLRRDPLLKNMDQKKIPEMVGRLLDVHRQYVHPGFF